MNEAKRVREIVLSLSYVLLVPIVAYAESGSILSSVGMLFYSQALYMAGVLLAIIPVLGPIIYYCVFSFLTGHVSSLFNLPIASGTAFLAGLLASILTQIGCAIIVLKRPRQE